MDKYLKVLADGISKNILLGVATGERRILAIGTWCSRMSMRPTLPTSRSWNLGWLHISPSTFFRSIRPNRYLETNIPLLRSMIILHSHLVLTNPDGWVGYIPARFRTSREEREELKWDDRAKFRKERNACDASYCAWIWLLNGIWLFLLRWIRFYHRRYSRVTDRDGLVSIASKILDMNRQPQEKVQKVVLFFGAE